MILFAIVKVARGPMAASTRPSAKARATSAAIETETAITRLELEDVRYGPRICGTCLYENSLQRRGPSPPEIDVTTVNDTLGP